MYFAETSQRQKSLCYAQRRKTEGFWDVFETFPGKKGILINYKGGVGVTAFVN
jgi:hypothetical protein